MWSMCVVGPKPKDPKPNDFNLEPTKCHLNLVIALFIFTLIPTPILSGSLEDYRILLKGRKTCANDMHTC